MEPCTPPEAHEDTRDLDSDADLDLDLDVAAVLAARRRTLQRRALASARGIRRRPLYRGSVAGRKPNKSRDFSAGLQAILRDYFGVDGQPPVYDERDFERRFRVPRSVFLRVYHAGKDQPWWKRTINATGRPQAHPLQKVVAAFRAIAYGETYDRADEYVRLSKTTIALAAKKLMHFIVARFGAAYLRPPTDAEVSTLLPRNAERGVPGCIGSLDCSHWEWTGCPHGHAGVYQNRKGKRSIVLEAVCDEDLWIWHSYVGAPGSYNDLNVLQESPLFAAVTAGAWPPRRPYTLNGRRRTVPYYLVDGIYPRYAFFAAAYETPTTVQQRTYNRLQEAVRKDVERLFAVLTARFHVALHPARYGTVAQLRTTANAAAILHIMMVELRRDAFLGRRRSAEARGEDVSGDGAEDGEGRDGGDIGESVNGGVGVEEGDGDYSGMGGSGVADDEGADGGQGDDADDGAEAGAGAAAVAGDAAGAVDGVGQDGVSAAGGGRSAVGVRCLGGLPHPGPTVGRAGARDVPFGRALLAWAQMTESTAHEELREDLCAHVWRDRGSFLAPYL